MRQSQVHDGEISVAQMARVSAECLSLTRMTSNAVDANELDTPALSGRILVHNVQPGLIAAAHSLKVHDDNRVEYEIDAALGCGILLSVSRTPSTSKGMANSATNLSGRSSPAMARQSKCGRSTKPI